MSDVPNGGRTTNQELSHKIDLLDHAQEVRMAELRGDLRSVQQTIDQVIAPTLKEHDDALIQLRARFVYALTIIGSAVGAVLFLIIKGWGGFGGV